MGIYILIRTYVCVCECALLESIARQREWHSPHLANHPSKKGFREDLGSGCGSKGDARAPRGYQLNMQAKAASAMKADDMSRVSTKSENLDERSWAAAARPPLLVMPVDGGSIIARAVCDPVSPEENYTSHVCRVRGMRRRRT